MGNNLRKAFLMMALLFSFSFMNAQHAHMNLGNLLESLPEVKTANTQLEALQKSLATKGQTMMDNYQKKAIDIQSRYQKGELSEVQARQEAEKLQLVEQKISAFDQDATMQIQKKRQELDSMLKRLSGLNPLSILNRGYTITYKYPENTPIRRKKDIGNETKRIKTVFYDGEIISQIDLEGVNYE